MDKSSWAGVFPAITTPFRDDLSVNHEELATHVRWLVDNGCVGVVALGSLGESATLTPDEKVQILETCRTALPANVPVIAGIAGLSTAECIALAGRAARAGCDGLMTLPAYVHKGDWRETKAHYSAVIGATKLSCMLYNNPIAYGTDVTPDQLAELCEVHDNLHAVKESSGDVRRVTALREGDAVRRAQSRDAGNQRCAGWQRRPQRLEDLHLLVRRQRLRFTERPERDDSDAAVLDQPGGMLGECSVGHRVIRVERRGNGGKDTGPVALVHVVRLPGLRWSPVRRRPR